MNNNKKKMRRKFGKKIRRKLREMRRI